MKIGFAKLGRAVLALGCVCAATAAFGQTVPDADVPSAGLDLPANGQLLGKPNPNVRKPTAIVNNAVITGTDVDQRVAMVIALNNLKLEESERERLRLQVLRSLIDETLQIQEAKANEITVPPEEVNGTFERVARSRQMTADQMRAWLRGIGSSERSIKRQIEGELAWSRLLRRVVAPKVNVGEAEVKAILDRMVADKGTPEFHLFEIFNYATPDRSNEVYTAQQRMIQQLKEGVPFEYLAQTYSEASTKPVGGDLGWVRLAVLPPELANAAQNMKRGEVAGPVELPGGFSILYLADQRQVLTSDARDSRLSVKQLALMFPAGTTDAQAQARAEEFQKATQAMRGCGDVEATAARFGAEVVTREDLVARTLPPALQDAMLGLSIGQATPPFGSLKEGVRVLVLCGRQDAAEDQLPSIDQMQETIENQRIDRRADRMLRDLRRDALVEYR